MVQVSCIIQNSIIWHDAEHAEDVGLKVVAEDSKCQITDGCQLKIACQITDCYPLKIAMSNHWWLPSTEYSMWNNCWSTLCCN